MKPIKASVGFTRGAGFVSGAIQYIDGGKFNHVYYRFDFADGGALIYESHIRGGVQITPYEHLLSAKQHGKVLNIQEVDLNLSPVEVQNLWNFCLPYHHKAYDARRIIGYYMFIRFARRAGKKFLKLHKAGKMTCNEFVIQVGKDAGLRGFRKLDFSFTIEPLVRFFTGKTSDMIIPGK